MTQEIEPVQDANLTENVVPNGPTTLEDAVIQLQKLNLAVKAAEDRAAFSQRKLSKFEKEADVQSQKILEDQGKFKELAENLQNQLNTQEQKQKDLIIKSAVTTALMKAGGTELVSKLIDYTKISISEDGTVDISEQLEQIKKEAPTLFNVQELPVLLSPSIKRATEIVTKGAYETELKACKSQREITAVMLKYGKN